MEDEDYENIAQNTPFQTPLDQHGGSIVLLTNPELEIHSFELTLRNAGEDEDGKLVPYGQALLNEEGIKSILGQLQSIVNQVTVMSNFEEEIPKLLEYFTDSLVEDLIMNRLRYNLKDYSVGDRIVSMANIYAYSCMRRAYMQGEKRFWKGSQQETTIKHEGTQQRGGGFADALGWRKK